MRLAADWLGRLERRPAPALVALCILQALALLAFALRGAVHNGWLYYQGGDQIWYTTGASLLAHLQLPPTFVGYGWSMVVAPIYGTIGPDFVSGLPPVILLNTLVLAPLGTLLVYGIGTRIGGRWGGLWCSLLWVTAPYVSLLVFTDRYHEKWFDQALPQGLGLTAMADYPSMIALLAAAFFVLRSLDNPGALSDGVVAGLLAGVAIGIKPSNALFLAGPALAYVAARRFREGGGFGVALLPALLTLAVWKQRGLGELPLFALGETREAVGAAGTVAAVQLHKYFNFDLDVWRQNMSGLREFTVGARVIQWLPVAGAIGLCRRSVPAAGLFAGWLGAFLLVKGTSPLATVESGSFWRYLMPAFPAYVILAAAIPLLVPTLSRRLGARLDAPAARRAGRRAVVAVAVVAAALPLAWVAVSSPIDSGDEAVLVDEILTPVDEGKVGLTVRAEGAARRLTWDAGSWPAGVFYRVYRTEGAGPDLDCAPTGAAARCAVTMLVLGTTRKTVYVDLSPPPGVTYRVGVAANYLDDARAGDVAVISPGSEDRR